jgi:hypothetical protein
MPILVAHPSPVPPETGQSRRLQLKPSPLRPECKAEERIFKWVGVNAAPPLTIDDPTIRYLENLASRESLRDPGSYGSGLRKFHLFCNIFSIPEARHLPAPFEVIHSFTLWAATDPSFVDPAHTEGTLFKPIAVSGVRKYLAAIRAWHVAQGWPPPLTEENLTRINWSLRGLENLQACRRSRPLRPPITVAMLIALKASLYLNNPFDACVWAMSSCAFWGMMRFGEVSTTSLSAFHPSKHLKRSDVHLGNDLDGKPYA